MPAGGEPHDGPAGAGLGQLERTSLCVPVSLFACLHLSFSMCVCVCVCVSLHQSETNDDDDDDDDDDEDDDDDDGSRAEQVTALEILECRLLPTACTHTTMRVHRRRHRQWGRAQAH